MKRAAKAGVVDASSAKDAGPETVTRHVGHCQICERAFKVQGNLMVLHGYRRPGDGWIDGRCDGEHEPPYELSCELIKTAIVSVGVQLEGAKLYLEKVRSGSVVHLSEWRRTSAWSKAPPEERQHAIGVTDRKVWDAAIAAHASTQEHLVLNLEAILKRFRKRVAAWKLAPLQEIDERGRTREDRDAADERRKVRQAAREEKQAKARALKEKRQAKAAERKKVLDEAGAEIRAAHEDAGADAADVAAARSRALSVLRELSKRKHKRLLGLYWERDLGADDAMVALGLAEPRKMGTMGHPWYLTRGWR